MNTKVTSLDSLNLHQDSGKADRSELMRLNLLFAPVLRHRARSQSEQYQFWNRHRLIHRDGYWRAPVRGEPDRELLSLSNKIVDHLANHSQIGDSGWCFTINPRYETLTILERTADSVVSNNYLILGEQTASKLCNLAKSLDVLYTESRPCEPPHLAAARTITKSVS